MSQQALSSDPSPSQLSSKLSRWRPTPAQLVVLFSYFKKHKYPTHEEKLAVLNDLDVKFNSELDLSQVSNWFQKERARKCSSGAQKLKAIKIYRKLSDDEEAYLLERFEKNKYPSLSEMVAIAGKLGLKLNKVENWYKHTRRGLAKEGQIALQERKYFNRTNLKYIQERFNENPHPSKAEIAEMTEHLNCDRTQVKNWFANNKKKLRLQDIKEKNLTQQYEQTEQLKADNNNVKLAQIGPLEEDELSNTHASTNISPSIITKPLVSLVSGADGAHQLGAGLLLQNHFADNNKIASFNNQGLFLNNISPQATLTVKRPFNYNLEAQSNIYKKLHLDNTLNNSLLTSSSQLNLPQPNINLAYLNLLNQQQTLPNPYPANNTIQYNPSSILQINNYNTNVLNPLLVPVMTPNQQQQQLLLKQQMANQASTPYYISYTL